MVEGVHLLHGLETQCSTQGYCGDGDGELLIKTLLVSFSDSLAFQIRPCLDSVW